MEKYIIIALILLFGIIYYFDKQQDIKTVGYEKNSTSIMDEDKPKKDSFLKTIVNSLITPKNNKYSKNSYRNHLDSDESQCSKPPTVDEKIITNFAGYKLEYPCIAKYRGSIFKTYDENDIFRTNYTLTLKLLLGAGKTSIWRQSLNEKYEGKQGFNVELNSNGNAISSLYVHKLLESSTKVKTIDHMGLDIYRKAQTVIAILKNHKDASDNYPVITCSLRYKEEIGSIFTNLYNRKYSYADCRSYWMLTKDIRISMRGFPAKYAYYFNEIYESIDAGLQEIIIERPNNSKHLHEIKSNPN